MGNHSKTESTLWGASFVFLFVLMVVLDLLGKYFSTNIFKNYQFAFSLPLPVWLMFLLYGIVICGLVVYCYKNYRQFTIWQSLSWLLIFTGAVLNVGERIVLGFVRDFIYIHFLNLVGVYNFADFYILGGLVLLLIIPMLTKHSTKL